MSIRKLLLLAFFLLMAVLFARYFAHRAKYGYHAPRTKRTMLTHVRTDRTALGRRPEHWVPCRVADRSQPQGSGWNLTDRALSPGLLGS